LAGLLGEPVVLLEGGDAAGAGVEADAALGVSAVNCLGLEIRGSSGAALAGGAAVVCVSLTGGGVALAGLISTVLGAGCVTLVSAGFLGADIVGVLAAGSVVLVSAGFLGADIVGVLLAGVSSCAITLGCSGTMGLVVGRAVSLGLADAVPVSPAGLPADGDGLSGRPGNGRGGTVAGFAVSGVRLAGAVTRGGMVSVDAGGLLAAVYSVDAGGLPGGAMSGDAFGLPGGETSGDVVGLPAGGAGLDSLSARAETITSGCGCAAAVLPDFFADRAILGSPGKRAMYVSRAVRSIRPRLSSSHALDSSRALPL
jgi:hypothetical protein